MSVVHKFTGKFGELYKWDGARFRRYGEGASKGATETWLIGKAEQAGNFAIRYYELEPGGYSREEQHEHDHGIVFMRGSGEVHLGDEIVPVSEGDVVYISPNDRHQIINTGEGILGWLCVIPAHRPKGGKTVWAEEGLDGLTTTR